jgi:DNA-binding CsgD family transcriptional regulator
MDSTQTEEELPEYMLKDAAAHALTESQYEVWDMAVNQNMSNKEIAAARGVSVRAVEKMRERGRREIREYRQGISPKLERWINEVVRSNDVEERTDYTGKSAIEPRDDEPTQTSYKHPNEMFLL